MILFRPLLLCLSLSPALAAAAGWWEVGAEASRFSNDRPSAQIGYAAASWTRDALTVYGEASRVDRFGVVDSQLLLGTYLPVTASGKLHLEARHSPSADVLAQHAFLVGYYQALPGGWTVEPAYQETRFDQLTIRRLGLSTEKYLGAWRLAHQISSVELRGERALNQQIRVDHFHNDIDRIGFYYAFGTDQEENEPGGVINKTRVDAYGITGQETLVGPWRLTYTLSQLRQGDSFTETGLRLGIRRQF